MNSRHPIVNMWRGSGVSFVSSKYIFYVFCIAIISGSLQQREEPYSSSMEPGMTYSITHTLDRVALCFYYDWITSSVYELLNFILQGCFTGNHIAGLVQERRNSIASALEFCLSCTNWTKQDRRWNADKPSAALDPNIPIWLTTSPAYQRPANFWKSFFFQALKGNCEKYCIFRLNWWGPIWSSHSLILHIQIITYTLSVSL